MMKESILEVKMDSDLKERVEKLYEQIGTMFAEAICKAECQRKSHALKMHLTAADEKIIYLLNLLNGIVETVPVQGNEPTDAQKAYENLQKFRHRGTTDIDYKADYIVSRNIKDFDNLEVPAVLPEAFLKAVQH